MDKNGVAVGIGSVSPPARLSLLVDPQKDREQFRRWNEFAAKVVTDHPRRFGQFAALSMVDTDGTLNEIQFAAEALHVDGFSMSTSYGDKWLGDPLFDPVFEELQRRRAVVFVHPTDAPCCTPATLTYQKSPMTGAWLEWPMNTARTIFSMITSGVLRRYPSVRFIFSHGGGVMALLVSRIEGTVGFSTVGAERYNAMFPTNLRADLATLYFEGAQAFDGLNYEALTKLVPTSHILFGSDYNRLPIAQTVQNFEQLRLPPNIKVSIERENALLLFPRFRLP